MWKAVEERKKTTTTTTTTKRRMWKRQLMAPCQAITTVVVDDDGDGGDGMSQASWGCSCCPLYTSTRTTNTISFVIITSMETRSSNIDLAHRLSRSFSRAREKTAVVVRRMNSEPSIRTQYAHVSHV